MMTVISILVLAAAAAVVVVAADLAREALQVRKAYLLRTLAGAALTAGAVFLLAPYGVPFWPLLGAMTLSALGFNAFPPSFGHQEEQ